MKQIILLVFTLLLLAACASQEKTEDQPYKFGAVLPLTGSNSFYGEYSKHGIDLAVEDINAAGGINGRQVEALYENFASDKTQVAPATQKLINVDNVDALFTVTVMPTGIMAPLAEDAKVPFIYVNVVDSFAANKTFVFKDQLDGFEACKKLFMQANDKERVALFGTNAEFTLLCKQGVEQIGELVAFEMYDQGSADFRTQFTKIKNSGSTAILLAVYAPDCPNAYKQIKELGINAQILIPFQSFGCGSTENTRAFGDVLKGAIGADIAVDEESTDPAFVSFKKKLEDKGHALFLRGTAVQYDDVMTMAKAYEGCKDTSCVANNLRNVAMKGVSGMVSYNGDQIIDREIMLTKYENGMWRRAG